MLLVLKNYIGGTRCLTKPRHGFRIGAAHHLADSVRYVFGKGDSPDFSRACVDMLERRSMGDMSEYWTSSKMMAMRRGLEVGAMFEWGGLAECLLDNGFWIRERRFAVSGN